MSQLHETRRHFFGRTASGIGVAIWLNTTETDNGSRAFRSNVVKLVMWR